MDNVTELIKFWQNNKHLPVGMEHPPSCKASNIEIEVQRSLKHHNTINSVETILSTLLKAWKEFSALDPNNWSTSRLQSYELYLIAKIVPLYFPTALGLMFDLEERKERRNPEGRKRKPQGNITGGQPKKPLTFADIIAMDSKVPAKFRDFGKKSNIRGKTNTPITISSGDESAENRESENDENRQDSDGVEGHDRAGPGKYSGDRATQKARKGKKPRGTTALSEEDEVDNEDDKYFGKRSNKSGKSRTPIPIGDEVVSLDSEDEHTQGKGRIDERDRAEVGKDTIDKATRKSRKGKKFRDTTPLSKENEFDDEIDRTKISQFL